ncbi:MAG: YdcF family protein [Microscillaceae bacterium]|nr:YdcF family protein [Microscillaceae bacterium]
MFFILSKTLDFFLMPVMWLLGIFMFALLTKSTRRRLWSLRLGLGLLLLLSNPFVINVLFLWWEVPPTPMKDVKHTYDVGIILSGVTTSSKSPKDRAYTNKGADRLLHTLMLYRQGKIKKILITGGVVDIFGNVAISEASQLANLLILSKVPKEDIILEEKSRNTRENALFTAKILKEKFPNKSYLLITSGFHMRRALGCFIKAEVYPVPFSVDFYSTDLKLSPMAFVPSEKALFYWYILIHEVLGYVVYGLLGYTA